MITIELLKSWEPCDEGFERFCELFPNGTDLETAGIELAEDGHPGWGLWLYNKCREFNLFTEITSRGYQNSGSHNSGSYNSGSGNSGSNNSGSNNSGEDNSGSYNSGYYNSGSYNSGSGNSGSYNSGGGNSGRYNSGSGNSGRYNSGRNNSGCYNSGEDNSGSHNSGLGNRGSHNSGRYNNGCFNSKTPKTIFVFDKICSRIKWELALKPDFLSFDLTYWVSEKDMTNIEKSNDPDFYIRGGQLREKDYKNAFMESWDKADINNREKVRELPNFDAEIFFEISGIDLRA